MSEVKTELFDVENYLALMNLYRDEWKYRDQWFISTFWRMVYLSLIISFLPNFLAAFSVESELVTKLPVWVFSVLGILCALFGLYIMIVENKKITYIDNAYRVLENELPEKYRVEKMKKSPARLRTNNVLCVVIFLVIILLSIVNIVSEYCF
ncbi:hypothetical protein D7V83_15970 [bacterium 0.1xD8-71]|nr:hypothetical protein D7V83_15970 [bacterium 0.1xD8-71]